MAQPELSLRHASFFERLGEMRESDAAWRATTAGLLVLRLVDAWIEEGPRVVGEGAWGARAVRAAVDELEGQAARHILLGVLDALEGASVVEMSAVAPRLMAYARVLDLGGDWRLAADVYSAVLAHVHPIDDADIAMEAHMRLGYCRRLSGQFVEAAAAYAEAGRIASMTGDLMSVLRARVGEAKLALARGNVPQAELILDETIARAGAGNFTELRALALHDRATVAHVRGDYERAIRLAYEALGTMTGPANRDRVLGDIAAAFLRLGVRSAARDAYLVLASTAVEQYVRWTATMNLMEIAALDRCQPAFEQYRRELAGEPLPVELQAGYWLMVGQAYAAFGEPAMARGWLQRAVDLANARGLNELLFRAEANLRALDTEAASPSRRDGAEPVASDVQDVADALRDLRVETLAVR